MSAQTSCGVCSFSCCSFAMVFFSCVRALCVLIFAWQTAAICALLLHRDRRSTQRWITGPRPGWEHLIWLLQPFFSILHAHLTAGVQGGGWWQSAHLNRFWQCSLLAGSTTCSLASAHPGPKSRAAQTGSVLKFLGKFLLGGGARVPALITRCWGSSSRTSRLDGSNCGRSTVSGMRLHQAYLLLLFLRHLHLHLLLVACRVFGLFGQWLQGGCSLGFRAALDCQRRPQGLRGQQTGKVVALAGGWRLFVIILLACHVCAAGHNPGRAGQQAATTAQKRSFRRACGRALRHDAAQPGLGGTWYRGRWHTVRDLQARRFASPQGTVYRSRERKVSVGDRFVHMITFNAGGLSAAAYDELMIWLHQPQCARYSIVVIEETWWKQDSMYSDQNWNFVHSAGSTGNQGKNTGILVMIRKSFVPEGCIKHRVVVPGRVLHVRLEQQKNFHLVCVYQHAWSHQVAQETMLARREKVWDAIRQVVQGVPVRDHCYILGDMNTPCVTRAGHCGAGVLEQPNPPPDVETFMGLLEALDLCILNSWSARSKSATYVHNKGKSQIDFVITRRLDAHPISRRACPLPDAGLFEWRGGGRHLPLSVCVPARRFMPDRSATAQVQTSFDLVRLREAVGAGSAEAVAFSVEVSRSLVGARIDTPQALNEHVMPILARHFPKTLGQARARPWQHHALQARYPRLWQLRRALGVGPPPGLHRLSGHVLRYWRLLAIYQREAREAKRASRALRKQYLRDELRQAENAYQRGDQKGLFEVMRRLAPKQRKAKVQLRGEDGRILSNAEELRVFTEYCRGLFSQGRCVATSSLLGQPFELEANALEQHMRKLSIYKAVPAHTLPPAVWKLCRQALAPILVQLADKAWQLRPSAPTLWCDSWLVWLNKVGKQGRSPDELRPIALQDTGGKIVSKHLAALLRPSVIQALREYPQFAYYPGRCLASALARVTEHCDRIRHMLKEHRSDLYSRRLGKKALPCYGGLMMALDLSKAFDRVSRSDLDLAMRQAQVNDDLRVIILQWHDSVHYHLRVHTHQDSVHCTTGVRQGCCLAPYLWALLSCSILTQIAERTDSKWVQFLLNAYADDVHEAWEVTSLADLQWFERCVIATFAVLKSFRMIINEDKCVLVCAIRGHLGKQWLRQRTRPYKEGYALFLSDGAGGEICLPLAKRMTYLGTVLSYEGYEEQSLQHRLSIAELQRSRLRKPLQCRHDLSLGGRIRLWRTCIWSTLCHGLSVTGLGYRSLCTLTAKVLRHVRAITGNQVHVGGDDNQCVLQQVRLEFPGEMLLLQTTMLIARLVETADLMISSPVLDRLRRVGDELGAHCRRYHEECRRAAEYFRVTQTEAVVRPQDGAPPEAVISGRDGLKVAKLVCDRCFLCLPDLKALKAHTRQQHDFSIPHMPGPFQRDKHGKDGMPTCLHCDRRFPSWSHLERHIREHNCEVHWLMRQEAGISPDQPDEPTPLMTTDQVRTESSNLPLARRDQVKSACLRDGWQSLLDDASLCAEMMHHCVICHQWVDQTQVKIHTRRVHPTEWQRFQADVTLECKKLARVAVSPCRWCGAVVKRPSEHSYKCSVAWQACFLGRLLTDDPDGCGRRDVNHVGACPPLSSHPVGTGGGQDAVPERGSQEEARSSGQEATGKGHGQGTGSSARKRGGQPPRTHGTPAAGPPGLIDQTGTQARGLLGKAPTGHGFTSLLSRISPMLPTPSFRCSTKCRRSGARSIRQTPPCWIVR